MGGVGKSCMSRVGGGGEQKKVSQKQHAKSGPEAAWQKVGQKQPAKFKAEVALLHYSLGTPVDKNIITLLVISKP